ncbi:SprT family protein [Paucilactobacillus kaifaensis]|uniref:SprT family protein n=1 Tax=Paucilactobacillus kaifaensis TaxID=2559921 RepID=UPI0010F45772|nr:SprT family protein [Paucilactobacillus kaifaensis]
MTNEQLQNLTKQWSEEYFHQPFKHETYFNARLKTTGGRYHLKDHHIDINPKMIDDFDLKNLRQVVLHELCHYHLHLSGQDYHHRSREFKVLLQQVGGARYAPLVPNSLAPRQNKKIVYQCTNCYSRIIRKRHFNTTRFVCARCGGHFELISAS